MHNGNNMNIKYKRKYFKNYFNELTKPNLTEFAIIYHNLKNKLRMFYIIVIAFKYYIKTN